MKKQADIHGPNRVRESESVMTNPSAPAYSPSKPKGLEDRAHPGHLTRGAAETKANPVSERSSAERPNFERPHSERPGESDSSHRKQP
jgi:hypothetical protein